MSNNNKLENNLTTIEPKRREQENNEKKKQQHTRFKHSSESRHREILYLSLTIHHHHHLSIYLSIGLVKFHSTLDELNVFIHLQWVCVDKSYVYFKILLEWVQNSNLNCSQLSAVYVCVGLCVLFSCSGKRSKLLNAN